MIKMILITGISKEIGRILVETIYEKFEYLVEMVKCIL